MVDEINKDESTVNNNNTKESATKVRKYMEWLEKNLDQDDYRLLKEGLLSFPTKNKEKFLLGFKTTNKKNLLLEEIKQLDKTLPQCYVEFINKRIQSKNEASSTIENTTEAQNSNTAQVETSDETEDLITQKIEQIMGVIETKNRLARQKKEVSTSKKLMSVYIEERLSKIVDLIHKESKKQISKSQIFEITLESLLGPELLKKYNKK
jgi:hypothetical protein